MPQREPEQPQEIDRRGLLAHRHPIDGVEGGEVLCPQLMRDERAAITLARVGITGDGHEKPVTQFPGLLEMPDMPWMDDIEAPVAKDHGSAGSLCGADEGGGLIHGDDLLAVCRHEDIIGRDGLVT